MTEPIPTPPKLDDLRDDRGLVSPKHPSIHYYEYHKGLEQAARITNDHNIPTIVPDREPSMRPKIYNNEIVYLSTTLEHGTRNANEYAAAINLNAVLRHNASPAQIPRDIAVHLLAFNVINNLNSATPDDTAKELERTIGDLQEREGLFRKTGHGTIATTYRAAREYAENVLANTTLSELTLVVQNHLTDLKTATDLNLREAVINNVPRGTNSPEQPPVIIVLPPVQPNVVVHSRRLAPTLAVVPQEDELKATFSSVLAITSTETTPPDNWTAHVTGYNGAPPVAAEVLSTANISTPVIVLEGSKQVEANVLAPEGPAELFNQEATSARGFIDSFRVNDKVTIFVAGAHELKPPFPEDVEDQYKKLLKQCFEQYPKAILKDPAKATELAIHDFEKAIGAAKIDAVELSIYFSIGGKDFIATYGPGATVREVNINGTGSVRLVELSENATTPQSYKVAKFRIAQVESNKEIAYLLGASARVTDDAVLPAIKGRLLKTLPLDGDKSYALYYLAPENEEAEKTLLKHTQDKLRELLATAGASVATGLDFEPDDGNPGEYDTKALKWIKYVAKNLREASLPGMEGFTLEKIVVKLYPSLKPFFYIDQRFEKTDENFKHFIGKIDIDTFEKMLQKLNDWKALGSLTDDMYKALDAILRYVKKQQGILDGDEINIIRPVQIEIIDPEQSISETPDWRALEAFHPDEIIPNIVETERGATLYRRDIEEEGFHLIVVAAPSNDTDESTSQYYHDIIEKHSEPSRSITTIKGRVRDHLRIMMQNIQKEIETEVLKGLPPLNLSLLIQVEDRTFVVKSGNADILLVNKDNSSNPRLTRPRIRHTEALGSKTSSPEIENWEIMEVTREMEEADMIVVAANDINPNFAPMQDEELIEGIRGSIINGDLDVLRSERTVRLPDERMDELPKMVTARPTAFAVAFV